VKKLIISIHDVTPYFLPELKVIFQELDQLKIKKYDLLIVPNWDKKYPINQNKEFVKLIKKHLTRDSRLVLHGYSHQSENKLHQKLNGIIGPSGAIEYVSVSEKEAEKRINDGLKIIKETFHVKPLGFVPPVWVMSMGMSKILKKYFAYYTTYFTIHYFSFKIRSATLCYTGGEIYLFDKLMLFLSSVRARFTRNKVVQLAIHPDDVRIGSFETEIKDLKSLLKRGWQLSLYEDFIK